MTSSRDAVDRLLPLLILSACSMSAALKNCGPASVLVNNWREANTSVMKTASAPTATDVTMSGEDTSDHFNASDYVTVTLNGEEIQFTPKPALKGIRDYSHPKSKNTVIGTCNVTCGGTTAQFDFKAYILDDNTATPQFSQQSYSVDVVENYPVNVTIPGLAINASDYDADTNNNAITFSVSGTSVFSTLEAEKTSDWPATYSTHLVLKKALDWTVNNVYKFNITAADNGGFKSTSDVTVTVKDVDNHPPVFDHSGYSAEALDLKAVGPLAVSPAAISASDPDTGGSLHYTLIDLPGGNWEQYFSLDPVTAELQLAKEIPAEVTTPSEISFTVQGQETEGMQYKCQTTLVIYLTPQPGEESSDVGYIVGLAVLGCLLVVVIVAAAVMLRRMKRNSPRGVVSRSGADWESAPTKLSSAAGQQYEVPIQKTKAPAAQPLYENPGFHRDESTGAAQFSVETDQQQTLSAPSGMTQPLYPKLQTTSEAVDEEASETLQAIEVIADKYNQTNPPMADAADDVIPTSPPMGEPSAPPEEPRPDYALKSVGFKDTVVCVTPADVMEAEDVDDDDEDEDLAEAEEAHGGEEEELDDTGEEKGGNLPAEGHSEVNEVDEGTRAGGKNSDDDSML